MIENKYQTCVGAVLDQIERLDFTAMEQAKE